MGRGTGYLYRVVVYYGRDTLLTDRPDLGHTPKVVLTLAEPLAHKGYGLYTDRYYTRPILADELEKVVTSLVLLCMGIYGFCCSMLGGP